MSTPKTPGTPRAVRLAARLAALQLALVAPLAAAPAQAQDVADAERAVQAVRAVPLAPGEHIRVDGTLSHPAWARAPVFDRFVEKLPVTGHEPSQATRVQVLFDGEAVYVGVSALDSEPARMRNMLVRADGVNRTQDFVVVYVDPIGARRSAQFFRVNSAGSLADGLHTAADDSEDFAPDFDWDAAVAHNAEGWTAVFRLPFASLRFAEGAQRWRFMVGRRMPREQFHLFTSVLIPREAASFIDRLQPLEGIELPERHAFLMLRPSATLRTGNESGARQSRLEGSLDAKWRPRAELVVDGTLNPDFSQVALDVPQLAGNQRFALFLAEKRPFFFESADLLRSPTDAVYTRSITAPRGGLRATWRGPGWAGTAFAIDDRGGGLVLLPGPYGTGFAGQPAARSFAARGKLEAGRGLQVGLIAASRRYAQGRGENDVAGPDVEWAFAEQWRVRAQWLRARTTAQPDDAGGLVRGAPREGDRVHARLARNSPGSETALTLDHIDRDFRHDGGFVGQNGARKAELFHAFVWQGVGPFNEFQLNGNVYRNTEQGSGDTLAEGWRLGLWAAGASNLEWRLNLQLRNALRTAGGAPLLGERYVNTGVVLTPAPWFPLLDAWIDAGALADTVADRVRPGVRGNLAAKLRPLARLEVEPTLSVAVLREGGELKYREAAQQWLAVWHFDSRHTLRAILQRATLDRQAEPGVAAAASRSKAGSLTYAFRRSAGTLLYLGATRSRAGGAAPRVTEAFAKLQLDVDEARRWLADGG
jgi:hypothetical protein